MTPTIFAPEDFTPRKGVMTRYGKKMVRSDFYGTVTVFMDHEQEKYVLARGWTSVRPGAMVVGMKGDKVTRFIVVSVGEAGATLAGSDRRLVTVTVDSITHEPTPGKCELEMECEVMP